ncbi:MAG: sigma-70 family RNA polymerase sigma factor [Planctomycetota bacterium]
MARLANAHSKASTLGVSTRFTSNPLVDREHASSYVVEARPEEMDGRGGDPVSVPILTRIAAGDVEAVDECLQKYGDLVWSIAKRLSKSSADAEDAAQDVFVELWQKAGSFDPTKAAEATFIAMVARRRLIDRLRRNKSQVDVECLDLDVFTDDGPLEGNVELQDEAAKAAKCLDRLPNRQQQVIALSVHQGASHRVISQQMDLPLGTVKTLARRGLIQLRDCMSRRLSARVEGGVS